MQPVSSCLGLEVATGLHPANQQRQDAGGNERSHGNAFEQSHAKDGSDEKPGDDGRLAAHKHGSASAQVSDQDADSDGGQGFPVQERLADGLEEIFPLASGVMTPMVRMIMPTVSPYFSSQGKAC